MPNAGPAPVERSAAVVPAGGRANAAQQNYLTIVETLKQNNGAEAKAILAMFGGDRKLRDQFLAVAFSSLAANSDLLYKATPMSIIQSIKDAGALGLKPDGIEGAIVRYNDQAKFMPMFQGYKRRMLNSGKVLAVDAKTVYTEDEFDYWTGPMGTEFRHHPAKARIDPDTGNRISTRGAFMGFYAYARTPEGFVYFRYMDVDQINHVRDTHGRTETKDGKPLPWATDYEQMALKTVIRQLQKDVPQEAVGAEMVRVEAENDAEIDRLRADSRQLSDGLDEVRNLALRAVGALPAEAPPSEPEAAGDSEEPRSAEEAFAGDHAAAVTGVTPDGNVQMQDPLAERAPDPGADPNVQAAMQLTAEQEQLARQRKAQR